METTEKKKHKSGFTLLKEKLAKAEAKNADLQKDLDFALEKHKQERNELKLAFQKAADELKEAEATIEQQSRKISQLTAELKVAQGNLEATSRKHERQLKAMYDHMGWFKRMTWDWHHAPTFKEDERWNETH